MSLAKLYTRSFAGGEITDELYGRLDLTKRQTGLAKALNFWVLPHGPAQNRSGFAYVLEVKDSAKKTRLIKFEYNTTQTYILEFGDLFIRFHVLGGTLVETGLSITAITRANPGVITINAHGYSNGQEVFLSGIGGMTQLEGRFVKVAGVTANTFQIQDLAGNGIDTTSYTAFTAGGTAARVYELTLNVPYVEADLFDLHYTQSEDVLTITHPGYAPRELRRLGATNWTLEVIGFNPSIGIPPLPGLTNGGPGGGTPVAEFYSVTALSASSEESTAQGNTSAPIDLTVAGNFVDIDPTPLGVTVAGAVRYNIYKFRNGLSGYIGQTDGSVLRDNNITPDQLHTPPISTLPLLSNNPGAVGYFDGRRVFAGTDTQPHNYWLTRSGTESNLTSSLPGRDDDMISGRIRSQDVQRIRHIIPLDILIFLTSGGEWKLAPQNSDILTPVSAAPKSISAEGASNVQPVRTGSSVVYAQDQGGRLRDLRYKTDTGTFVANYLSNDISLMAPHLFDGYTIVDMAYVKAPVRIVWCVRSDGVLLGVTYLPEQDVIAWHQHTTDGTFESVAAVREGTETALYAVVKRSVNGRNVRYVERLHSRRFALQKDAFFVDAGVTYSGAATTTIGGLWHLEGKQVSILADGAVIAPQAVVNGTITLDQAASTVQIGLAITADLQTLPLSIEGAQASGQGALKNVNQVYLRVKDSSGIKAGPDFGHLREYKQRTNEPYGSPPRLVNGQIQITIDSKWGQDAPVCIRQSDPLPITVTSMTLEVAVGG